METAKMKVLWMIIERGDRTFWTRVGVGYINRDGSINLVLDAIPLSNAKLQLRDYTPRDAQPAESPAEIPTNNAARTEGAQRTANRNRRTEGRTEFSP